MTGISPRATASQESPAGTLSTQPYANKPPAVIPVEKTASQSGYVMVPPFLSLSPQALNGEGGRGDVDLLDPV